MNYPSEKFCIYQGAASEFDAASILVCAFSAARLKSERPVSCLAVVTVIAIVVVVIITVDVWQWPQPRHPRLP